MSLNRARRRQRSRKRFQTQKTVVNLPKEFFTCSALTFSVRKALTPSADTVKASCEHFGHSRLACWVLADNVSTKRLRNHLHHELAAAATGTWPPISRRSSVSAKRCVVTLHYCSLVETAILCRRAAEEEGTNP